MITLFKRHFAKATAAACVAVSLIAAAPAAANSNANNATAADVTAPIKDAQAESLTSGDPRFRQLFASWTALDRTGPGTPVEQPTVAVPSRMPLAGSRLTSGYGMRDHPILRKRASHTGVDLAAPTGTPVYATADGVVGRADWFSSYGLYISLDHGAELETRYAHLSRLAVAAGDSVKKGDIIGYVGSTGRSTGPHLHYEVRVDGVAVNPIPYMLESEAQLALAGDSGYNGEGGD